jgi:hypothetical protein
VTTGGAVQAFVESLVSGSWQTRGRAHMHVCYAGLHVGPSMDLLRALDLALGKHLRGPTCKSGKDNCHVGLSHVCRESTLGKHSQAHVQTWQPAMRLPCGVGSRCQEPTHDKVPVCREPTTKII